MVLMQPSRNLTHRPGNCAVHTNKKTASGCRSSSSITQTPTRPSNNPRPLLHVGYHSAPCNVPCPSLLHILRLGKLQSSEHSWRKLPVMATCTCSPRENVESEVWKGQIVSSMYRWSMYACYQLRVPYQLLKLPYTPGTSAKTVCQP